MWRYLPHAEFENAGCERKRTKKPNPPAGRERRRRHDGIIGGILSSGFPRGSQWRRSRGWVGGGMGVRLEILVESPNLWEYAPISSRLGAARTWYVVEDGVRAQGGRG